jgi:hypothetical protein
VRIAAVLVRVVVVQRAPPAQIALAPVRIVAARDHPAAQVVRATRDLQRVAGAGRELLDPLRDELGVRLLLRAALAARDDRVRIAGVGGVDRRDRPAPALGRSRASPQ